MDVEEFYYDPDIEHITEIIKNRLFFAVTYDDLKKTLRCTSNVLYFCTDDELIYMSYYFDFGPLNISCLYKFCAKVNSFLQCTPTNKKIVYYTRNNECSRVNSAFLIGSYAVIYLDLDPRQVYRMLLNAGGPFRTFVDASQGTSQYTLRLLDCLLAVEKSRSFQFFNFNDFNVSEYDTYSKLQNGDMNWLLPRKFLAFIGPTDNELMNSHSPAFYIKYFQKNDIRTVVRLNNKAYDSSAFLEVGINHYDLIFPDGTTPPKSILLRFLEISERTPHAIAVHCKAGLGRTGSLIGAFIIKHYHFTAREAIAWMRICRPGSVIGQQQGWLEKIEGWLWKQGSNYRIQHFGEGDKIPTHKYGIYSKIWPVERKKAIILKKKEEERKSEQRLNVLKNYMPGPVKMHISTPDSTHRRRATMESLQNKEKEAQQYKRMMQKINVDSANSRRVYDVSVDSARRNRYQYRQLSADSTNRRLSDCRTYEQTQGDRLNEVKLRRHITETTRKPSRTLSGVRRSDSKIRRANQQESSDSLVYKNKSGHFSEVESSHRMKMRQVHNNSYASPEGRKKVLEMLSPLKLPTIERMYRRT